MHEARGAGGAKQPNKKHRVYDRDNNEHLNVHLTHSIVDTILQRTKNIVKKENNIGHFSVATNLVPRKQPELPCHFREKQPQTCIGNTIQDAAY